jgi:hypothetical protein
MSLEGLRIACWLGIAACAIIIALLGLGVNLINDRISKRDAEVKAAAAANAPEHRIPRIEFLAQLSKEVRTVVLFAKLKRNYSATELGHFRLLVEITALGPEPSPTFWLSARDANWTWHENGKSLPLGSVKSYAWTRNPNEILQNTVMGGGPEFDRLVAFATIASRGPFQTIGSFDNKFLKIYATESLVGKIEHIGLALDGYVVLGLPTERLLWERRSPLEPWPESLSEDESSIEWVDVVTARYWPNDDSKPPMRPPLMIDYDKYTPARIPNSDIVNGWEPVTVPEEDPTILWPY